MVSLGINIGSSSLKAVLLDGSEVVWNNVVPHDGDMKGGVHRALAAAPLPVGVTTLVTGNEGRHLFNIANTIEPICVESALAHLGYEVDAVVSMGGEDLIVYTIDTDGKIVNNFSGSKCASGTGEFFKQQLARMDMKLVDVESVPDDARILPLSTRCSVFMKSDCTHRLNKGEATKDEIVVSLSNVMAGKVVDFLARARIQEGPVLLTGGVTRNRHIIRFIREQAPEVAFIVPDYAPCFEALGAALLARTKGVALPETEAILRSSEVRLTRLEPLTRGEERVTVFDDVSASVEAGREYILGVDGGSTTTKACLVDAATERIVASHYGRTHGDPIGALKRCLNAIREKVAHDTGGADVRISLAATTGSSREILGVFLETHGVYNEIIAHSMGTTHFRADVDTIFEIGGQDAKYVLLENGVPIDYAMNEACSAGTGSFLEESAQGDLNISEAKDIAAVALAAKAPLKFGEHCSAFINSDIRKAVQQGASREDITAGVVTSIVSNYLNRVVGSRTIGRTVFLQGGVAKNVAVPLAFATLMGREILVPPHPELMGCFGVALLAKRKHKAGLLQTGGFDLAALADREVIPDRVFTCKACENRCPVKVLKVDDQTYRFGGRCNKYANTRRPRTDTPVMDYVAARQELLFRTCAPDPATVVQRRPFTVGIPRCLSVHTLYPLYASFFHALGIRWFLSDEVLHEGIARVESDYCYPAEIAHGAVADVLQKGADYIFLPHLRDLPSLEESVHATFCPITQGLPYYLGKAFPDVPAERFLPLVVSFKHGPQPALEQFKGLGDRLGISAQEIAYAFDQACHRQEEFLRRARELGRQALREARNADHPVVALLGRPYNAFTGEANMGIPRKLATRGCSIIPFDILPLDDEEIPPNMYWYYGQLDMKAAAMLRKEPNIYVTYVTNFSCAPDSFILHYLKWTMGSKPFLVLELDSHTADAGIDTRIEAFLDIIEGYRRRRGTGEPRRSDDGWRFVSNGRDAIHLHHTGTGERVPVKHNNRVTVLLSNMGSLSTDLSAAVLRASGIGARALPVPTSKTLQIARAHASGKECVPSHLVLGSALEFMMSPDYRKDELYLLFVPVTTGPCRTGQYYVFFENVLRDLKVDNVVLFTLGADTSYGEIGPRFARDVWWGLVAADYLKDVRSALLACAAQPRAAAARFDELWQTVVGEVEGDLRRLLPGLRRLAGEVARIPARTALRECAKVLVVGEIYVRRDDFAVDELVELMASRKIVAKVSGIGEWIHYLDFVRSRELRKKLASLPWYARSFSPAATKLRRLRLEMLWKRVVARRIRRALAPSRLLPHAPESMKRIMSNTSGHFMSHELNSEIAVSCGAAATAMQDGYAGVVNISPFACLIGRVIEGIYTPWARERRFPTISVEIDGNPLPPGIVNKLEIFMVNVLRFRSRNGAEDFVETQEVAG